MANSNGKITAPISLKDVQTVLGSSSNDIGKLTTYISINKWSKYKPTVYNSVKPDDDQWKASDGKCGLNIPTYPGYGSVITPMSFLYDLKRGTTKWGYKKPIGDNGSPYRLSDFKNYYHKARSFIDSFKITKINEDASHSAEIPFSFIINIDSLALTDIKINGVSLSDFYVGAILFKGDTYFGATSENNLSSESSDSIKLTNLNSRNGNYTIAFFLSSVKRTCDDNDVSGVYIPLDMTDNNSSNLFSINIVKYGVLYTMLVFGEWNSEHTNISFTIHFINDSSSQYIFEKIHVFVYSTTGTQKPSAGTNEKEMSSGIENVTVPANTEADSLTYNISIANYSSSKTYWIGCREENGTLTDDGYQQIKG